MSTQNVFFLTQSFSGACHVRASPPDLPILHFPPFFSKFYQTLKDRVDAYFKSNGLVRMISTAMFCSELFNFLTGSKDPLGILLSVFLLHFNDYSQWFSYS